MGKYDIRSLRRRDNNDMKKSILIIFAIIACFLFCGCSDNQTETDNTALIEMAYANEDYEEVVELTEQMESDNSKYDSMISVSKAYIAFDEKKYKDVVSFLDSVDNGREYMIYSESVLALCAEAYNESEVITLVEFAESYDFARDTIYSLITSACSEFDYEAFLLMDEIIEKLPNIELKKELEKFSEDNAVIRAKSFLLGEWEWQNPNSETKTRVKTYLYAGEKILGEISVVGTEEQYYKYSVDEMYWKDFVFSNSTDFSCYHMLKSSYGTLLPHTANGKVDFENNSLYFSFSNPNEGTYFVNAERHWVKIS